jgi:hypothetical protein
LAEARTSSSILEVAARFLTDLVVLREFAGSRQPQGQQKKSYGKGRGHSGLVYSPRL